MRKSTTFAIFLAAALAGACKGADAPAARPPNAVEKEMRLLVDAMETSQKAIASGDFQELPHALHRVHAASQETEHAVATGAYRPPKNGGELRRFHELDVAFHEHLDLLAAASEKNDVAAAKVEHDAATRACEGCHAEFR